MIIKEKISKKELERLFDDFFETILKLVVDIEKGILSAGCEFHIDCSEELSEKEGSHQKNLWGANLHRDTNIIDFVSLINIKPTAGNRTMEIQNQEIKNKVEKIIKELLCTN
ncbi:hypothetical protein KKD04_03025 [Patescibacteria group bacterium]|nr:hypothetical protein [Patescibacteria group bacterium]